MARVIKESLDCFAVKIEDYDDKGRNLSSFALGNHGTRAIYLKRKPAMEFCKELRKHIKSKCKVVKVHVAITEVRLNQCEFFTATTQRKD